MTRLNKELTKRGIIYTADDLQVALHGIEYDCDEKLVAITDDFIITVWVSAVMDPELHIYDRHTFAPISGQYLNPERMFNGGRTWGSYTYGDEEVV